MHSSLLEVHAKTDSADLILGAQMVEWVEVEETAFEESCSSLLRRYL